MSVKLINALNYDLEIELAGALQYMWHHVIAKGMESINLKNSFREFALEEMKHIERLAKRISYLGGALPVKIPPVRMGGGLKQMIKDNLAMEEMAVRTYREHITLADKEKDAATSFMLEKILAEEEGHADALLKLSKSAE